MTKHLLSYACTAALLAGMSITLAPKPAAAAGFVDQCIDTEYSDNTGPTVVVRNICDYTIVIGYKSNNGTRGEIVAGPSFNMALFHGKETDNYYLHACDASDYPVSCHFRL